MRVLLLAALTCALLAIGRADAAELVMFEQRGCPWCAAFDREIGPVYAKTPEGARAPLRRVDIDKPLPRDLGFIAVERLTSEGFYDLDVRTHRADLPEPTPRSPEKSINWQIRVRHMAEHDPVRNFEAWMRAEGLVDDEALAALQQRIEQEFEDGHAFALASPFPEPADAFKGNWTDDGYWASEPGRGGGTEAG